MKDGGETSELNSDLSKNVLVCVYKEKYCSCSLNI